MRILCLPASNPAKPKPTTDPMAWSAAINPVELGLVSCWRCGILGWLLRNDGRVSGYRAVCWLAGCQSHTSDILTTRCVGPVSGRLGGLNWLIWPVRSHWPTALFGLLAKACFAHNLCLVDDANGRGSVGAVRSVPGIWGGVVRFYHITCGGQDLPRPSGNGL